LATKKKTSKKQNFIQRYARETTGELRKVSWPSREEAMNLTVIVIITMIFTGAFLSLVSGLSSRLMNFLLGI
jgi:preprotein translocase subunit SecE